MGGPIQSAGTLNPAVIVKKARLAAESARRAQRRENSVRLPAVKPRCSNITSNLLPSH